jgi:hypothetical protein
MTRGMRAAHAILVLLPLVLAAACSDDACSGPGCEVADSKYGLGDRTIRDAREKTFTAAEGAYTVVRIEYGYTLECDELDDEDCSYSTYCAIVYGGQDYPLDAYFVTDEDVLFDLDEYCYAGVCDMPAYELAVFDDEAFGEWLDETDPEDDILASCF